MLLDPELLKKTSVFALGTGELLAYVGGGYFLGGWVDRKLSIGFPLIAVLIPLAGLSYFVWRMIREYKNETK